jgi:hypothetical protein
MALQHIVVDGSNIATEGRSAPSLAQLEEAVAELRRENPDAEVTVIVDATFAHRIDSSELQRFEEAVLKGEYVHPPAGAIGRGDAFLLRVAEKVDGTVLSNDSFQEFHGEHPWLFERGRLIGATPVPGIGWIFTPRTPVRGPTSRKAVRETDRAKRQVTKAIKVATKEAVGVVPVMTQAQRAGSADGGRPRRVADATLSKPSPAAVNDPLTFVSFIAEHRLGAEIVGRVEGYTSHGAIVMVGNTQCYVPLANLAHPPPRSAREVLKREEERVFILRALDAQRRGVELALPGVAAVSGQPSEAMVEAEMRLAKRRQVTSLRELGPMPVPTKPPPHAPAAHKVEEPALQPAVPAPEVPGEVLASPRRSPAARRRAGAGKQDETASRALGTEAGPRRRGTGAGKASMTAPATVPAAKPVAAKGRATQPSTELARVAKTRPHPASPKTPPAKKAARPARAEQVVARPARAEKTAIEQPARAKAPAKKKAAQPAPAEKTASQQPALAKAPAKKTAAKKSAQSAPAETTPAKKAAQPAPAEMTPAKKAAGRTALLSKAATHKTPAKKAAQPRKAPGR